MKRSLTILLTLFALTFSTLGITTPAVAADKYVFPAYNNVTLNEQLRFAVP